MLNIRDVPVVEAKCVPIRLETQVLEKFVELSRLKPVISFAVFERAVGDTNTVEAQAGEASTCHYPVRKPPRPPSHASSR